MLKRPKSFLCWWIQILTAQMLTKLHQYLVYNLQLNVGLATSVVSKLFSVSDHFDELTESCGPL